MNALLRHRLRRPLVATLLTLLVWLSATVAGRAATHTWMSWQRDAAKPANVTLIGNTSIGPISDPRYVLRLFDNGTNQHGLMVATRPAGVPAYTNKNFQASAVFEPYGGAGGRGFSLNFGPDENRFDSSPTGPVYEAGANLGLGISFEIKGDEGRIRVRYNGVQVGDTYAIDLWDTSGTTQNRQVFVAYDANGLTIVVYTYVYYNGTVIQRAVAVSNLVIPGWNPLPTWKFFIAGRTGTQTDTMRLVLNDIQFQTFSEPPSIVLPFTDFVIPEDRVFTLPFEVRDAESTSSVVVTATSSNPTVVSDANLTVITNLVGTTNRSLILRPETNAVGNTVITLRAIQDGDVTTATLQIQVTPIDDPPILGDFSDRTIAEDTTLSFSYAVSDVDNTQNLILVNGYSSNPALVPNSSIVSSGSTGTRNLTITPAPHAVGTATITVVATNPPPFGGGTSKTFVLTVTNINDVPVSDSRGVLRVDRGLDGLVVPSTAGFGGNNSSHTIEAWIKPLTQLSNSAVVLKFGAGVGNALEWRLHPIADSTNELELRALTLGIGPGATGMRLPIGRWSHVATTWDSVTANYLVYINGLRAPQSTISPVSYTLGSAPPLFVGFSNSVAQASGEIDEVRIWNGVRTEGDIQLGLNGPLTGLEPGLIGYWRFDEVENILAFDSAPAGGRSNGQLIGAARFALRRDETGLIFDGVNDFVQVIHNPNLNAFPITAAAWIKTTNLTGAVLRKWNLADGYMLEVQNGVLAGRYISSGGGTVALTGSGPKAFISDGLWHHVAFVAQVGNGSLYVDGEPVATGPFNGAIGAAGTTQPLQIGGPNLLGNYAGFIDDITIWNRALSLDDIQANRHGLFTNGTVGLVAYYPCAETSGNTLTSQLPGNVGLNGTLLNGVARGQEDPVNRFGTLVLNEDTSSSIFLPGLDVELYRAQTNSSLVFSILTPPGNGTLTVAGNTWSNALHNPVRYLPATNFIGTDRFTYRLTDNASGTSQVATVFLRVADLNDLPTITAIDNFTIEEDTATGPIPIVVGDAETPAGALTLTVVSSDTRLIPLTGIVFSGSGSNRTVTITPAAGEVGVATIDITISDSALPLIGRTTETFSIRVDPKPAYALIDLGALPDPRINSFAGGVNDLGWAVGWAQSQDVDRHAFLNRGLSGTGATEDLHRSTDVLSEALGINLDNEITGSLQASTASTARRAWIYRAGTLTDLSPRITGGDDSVGYAINGGGDIAGSYRLPNTQRRGYRLLSDGLGNFTFSSLDILAGGSASEAFAINSVRQSAGYSTIAGGAERAVRFDGTNPVNLGVLAGYYGSRAHGINDDGQVVGYAQTNATAGSPRRAFKSQSGTLADLGVLPDGLSSEAYAVNFFGQVVGTGTRRINSQTTLQRAFLHTAGQMRDLNDLVLDSRDLTFGGSTWQLEEGRAINRSGAIVGTGTKDGRRRAFLAVPGWVIGRQIARPAGAVARLPEIEILSGGSDDNAGNAFYWSEFERKLYAIRPVTARLKWFTSLTDSSGTGTNLVLNTDRIVVEGVTVWPRNPIVHVALSPVQVEPAGIEFPYSFQSVIYDAEGGTRYEPTSKTFNSGAAGYSVLYYLKSDGAPPNPQRHAPHFDVVRTWVWSTAPTFRDNVPAVIGDRLTDPGHQEYQGRNGLVFYEGAFYDGVGPDRAYDRASRTGPIIPVNLDSPATAGDDMVVIWFRTNSIGVPWASVPVRYAVAWPASSDVRKIVIASGLGSGDLPANQYPNKTVYQQTSPGLPGYNPNEEHALIVDNKLFALRNDLNDAVVPKASEPYALLKYRNPLDGQWSMIVYQVVAEQAPWFFRYSGDPATGGFKAGNEIQPPFPLSVLPLCAASAGVSGPWWEDWQGKIYARAAGLNGANADVGVRWFYPLQPGFFYDLNRDGTNDAATGDCLAWLDRRKPGSLTGVNAAAGTPGQPITVTYDIAWPATATLQIGETLLESKHDLPSVKDMASVQLIFDDLNPNWNPLTDPITPLNTLARLYDPLSTRTYRLAAGEKIPDAIKRTPRGANEQFDDLPASLQSRLAYDPVNRWLLFSGVLDTTGIGEPLLLPNVITSRERDRIKQLAAGDTGWAALVNKLYDLTRNPNQVDLSPVDREPDSFTDQVTSENLNPGLRLGLTTINGKVVPEKLGALPKALTSAIGGVPPAPFAPGNALRLSTAGTNGAILPSFDLLNTDQMTVELWVNASNLTARPIRTVIRQANASGGAAWAIEFRNAGTVLAFSLNTAVGGETSVSLPITASSFEGQWRHLAAVYNGQALRLLVDGRLQLSVPKTGGIQPGGGGFASLGATFTASATNNPWSGDLDEIRVWNVALSDFQIARDRTKWLTGGEPGLIRYHRCDETGGSALTDHSGGGENGALLGTTAFVTSTAPTGVRPRYLTLAENNDPALPGLPVALHVIRVDDGPFAGDLKVLPSANVFDQRLTLRHSSEFGGDPDPVEFEWYYKPDSAGFDATDLPTVNIDGGIADPRGWIPFTGGNRDLRVHPPELTSVKQGVNEITFGDGGESGLLVMSDNWLVCRYRGYNVRGDTNWSQWIGDPASPGTPRAMLAEGWIKRVVRGLNPFDQRVKDFHAAAANTFASMLVQAGQRYEGDIAFNPGADNLNRIGLIEAYTTVLNRGRRLSIDGTPQVDFNPANNALVFVSSRIADFYSLLGNEAYADAQDPTIGFGTGSTEYGAAASSIFAFQNQVDSLLEEELGLLRGRDDRSAGVGGRPIYNRLFWNFTLGEGEIAYQQNYNVSDQDFDGDVDEFDARIVFPQGHGDAWGHYLTATTTYYELLRHPFFTWIPRTESVLVAGAPVEVDYLDERKFASASAAKARTGREIVDLTYRLNYVEDPAGQWQGYKDTDRSRAWGVDEWARRAGQAAYFDWLTANAILPATDPNPAHTGIQKIDRTTVRELGEIATAGESVQATLDQADAGLNPLGLAKGVVPFDIDPSEIPVEGLLFGRTHFEQIRDRAQKAVNNAVSAFNEANRATQLLRQNQDSTDDLTRNVRQQELDYKNRLIEIYGYPYAGDIGPGKPYPSGYNGPDLYKYMYIDVTEITGETFPPRALYTGYYKPSPNGDGTYTFYTGDVQESFTDFITLEASVLDIPYPISAADYGFSSTPEMGQRRAPGEIQLALQDIVRANADLKVALQDYDGLIQDLRDMFQNLEARRVRNTNVLALLDEQKNTIVDFNTAIGVAKGVEVAARRATDIIHGTTEITVESLPKVLGTANDVTSAGRGAARVVGAVLSQVADITGDVAEISQEALSLAKEQVGLETEISIELEDQAYDVIQAVHEIEAKIRNEPPLRIKVYAQVEQIRQLVGRYRSLLAEGVRVQEQLLMFRQNTAADVTGARYQDMTFRIFRNDALRKYRSQFDLAARYVYLAATAYDYDSNLLGNDNRSGRNFLTDIVRQRALGQVTDGQPVVGQAGLADPLARLNANYEVIKTQFGLNNPAVETTRFSLRQELFRMTDTDPNNPDDASDREWRQVLNNRQAAAGYNALRVDNLWAVPEFRRYCRPFAPESAGPQPGLILRFPSKVTFGLNFFGRDLAGGDSSYDSSRFATRIRSAGIWFQNYDGNGLSQTPRVYFVPVGLDVLRSPNADDFNTREWRVVDQALPVPFPIGNNNLNDPLYIPSVDSLGGIFAAVRRHSAMRAYHDTGFIQPDALTTDTRLIGRSVWNTDWMMIIPGGTFLANPEAGLDAFIQSNTDILFLLQSFSYSGN